MNKSALSVQVGLTLRHCVCLFLHLDACALIKSAYTTGSFYISLNFYFSYENFGTVDLKTDCTL